MGSNQSEDTAIAELRPGKHHPYSRDARGVEKEALAVEREARAVEREARALEDEVLRRERPLVPSLPDLLAAADGAVALCQELLDQNPPDWDQHDFVETLVSQLQSIADEIRTATGANEAPGPSVAPGGTPKAPPAKK